MQKQIIGISIAAAMAIGIAGAAFYSFEFHTPRDAVSLDVTSAGVQTAEQSTGGEMPASAGSTAHRLEIDKKIPLGSFRPLGPRAYEIIRPRELRPHGDALLHVQQLMQRMERGDANAAYEIHLAISECRTFNSSRADDLSESSAAVGAEKWFLEKTERILKECESLILAKDIYEGDWLSRSAAMGSQEAMRAYALSPEETLGSLNKVIQDPEKLSNWKHNSSTYLNELADQGNISAIGDLERAYASGQFSAPDPIRALAYAQVVQRVSPGWVTDADLRKYEIQLNTKEKAHSQSLANEIYLKCCTEK
ncbi:hypothetical protein C1922_01495 [Stenotrophomonas sp. ZAC14D2_NAIMI4_7]|uniref:hypothetical protein n=1 Tax=Stenotrophomonas sp. ZAC14D2_NAIMI4_7 TaxID=2072405 RepID=UPI000D53DB2A|nr:hypothetical protein [Stenotrophomonas sp. ZAC14D2_NAIMI4_7]AWH16094.1 hypothetical protein C1922_01495 [Stenotrophomonas sp. ZAC14D2_NAIMI4_7]